MMFRRIQPATTLQSAHGFDEIDLAANRARQLSQRQRLRYVASRLGEHLLGALVVLFVFALIVYMLRLWPTLEAIGVVAGITLIAALALSALHITQGLQPEVQAATGPLRKAEVVPLIGSPLDEIMVGSIRFFVRTMVYVVAEEGTICTAYYLPRSPRAGNPILLSLEPVPRVEKR